MNPSIFRKTHLLQLLSEYEAQDSALDYFISRYFRAHKALGSKDRAWISDTVYALIRWRGLLEYLLKVQRKPLSWEALYGCYLYKPPMAYFEDSSIPLHIRVSFPEWLFQAVCGSWGEQEGVSICLASNEAAPTTVRVNTQKIDRESALQMWLEKGFLVAPCKESPIGITFQKKINFFSLPEFRTGLFEVQDEASQLVAHLCPLQPGWQVMDFCAGSGGKTLAFAHELQGKGQIHLHDIRLHALHEARRRLRRAGVQNAQIVHADEVKKLKCLKGCMDMVFVDAPCSGTGTLRRNPDMKWKLTPETIERVAAQQRVIFDEAVQFLKPRGKIVYATCSILKQENQDQVAYFLAHYPLTIEGEVFQSFPKPGEKDGFFAVVLARV